MPDSNSDNKSHSSSHSNALIVKEIEELQVKVAFLEESVAQLSDEFYSQQRELDALKKQYANLIDKLNSPHSGEVEHNIILNEKPPHY